MLSLQFQFMDVLEMTQGEATSYQPLFLLRLITFMHTQIVLLSLV